MLIQSEDHAARMVAVVKDLEGKVPAAGTIVTLDPCIPPHDVEMYLAEFGRPCMRVVALPMNETPAMLLNMLLVEGPAERLWPYLWNECQSFFTRPDEPYRVLVRMISALSHEDVREKIAGREERGIGALAQMLGGGRRG